MKKGKILIPIISEENPRPDCPFSDVCCACFDGCDHPNDKLEDCFKFVSWSDAPKELVR